MLKWADTADDGMRWHGDAPYTDADTVEPPLAPTQLQDLCVRNGVFAAYRIDEQLMARAKPDAAFMHCLPAHRGWEVTQEVMDGPQSIVYENAENRLHVQKAVMALLMQ